MEEYTKYEKARIIGSRALQISMGAPFMVKISEEELKKLKYNPIEIAKLELKEGLVPITVKRPFPTQLKEDDTVKGSVVQAAGSSESEEADYSQEE